MCLIRVRFNNMTLGEKIKKCRKLHKLSQKKLGLACGFLEASADVRIRQYENNKQSPKSVLRKKIVEALDIDDEAISNFNISTDIDIMHMFFELEEKLGMTIEKNDGKTLLVFDDSNNDIATLINYMNIWYNKKTSLPNNSEITNEQMTEYLLWKTRFKKNIDNE